MLMCVCSKGHKCKYDAKERVSKVRVTRFESDCFSFIRAKKEEEDPLVELN